MICNKKQISGIVLGLLFVASFGTMEPVGLKKVGAVVAATATGVVVYKNKKAVWKKVKKLWKHRHRKKALCALLVAAIGGVVYYNRSMIADYLSKKSDTEEEENDSQGESEEYDISELSGDGGGSRGEIEEPEYVSVPGFCVKDIVPFAILAGAILAICCIVSSSQGASVVQEGGGSQGASVEASGDCWLERGLAEWRACRDRDDEGLHGVFRQGAEALRRPIQDAVLNNGSLLSNYELTMQINGYSD